MSQRKEVITTEGKPEYILLEEDRKLIIAFEFKISNNFWSLSDAIEWVEENPKAKILIDNIRNFQQYFNARRQAILDSLPNLTKSRNKDMRAFVSPLTIVVTQLDLLNQALTTFLTEPSATAATTLKNQSRNIFQTLTPQIEQVANNPAYQAYKKYIKANNLESERITLDFELTYGEDSD